MIEIAASRVKKNFGFKNVFDSFDLEVSTGERVGLIGPNGCGKSTLFKLITKEETPDSGIITIRKGAKIGFLSQMPFIDNNETTVRELLNSTFKDTYDIATEMKRLEEKMGIADSKELEKILDRYGVLQQRFVDLDGYSIDSKINEICNKFKINHNLLDRPFLSLSGGEKTIVGFATIMLSNPDILLLDEPTNNLDIDTLEWLEKYLKNYSGTIIMSSHDRYFLDKVANKIVLIERGKSEIFYGNYSYYLEENERRTLSEFEQYKDQQKMIEAMKKKIKQLQEFGRLAAPSGESFFKRAASIQKRLDKIELLNKPEEQKEIPLNFQMNNRSGKQVLLINNLDLNIGDKNLLKDTEFSIYFKDKICLMGKNGCGKSTLIKHIINLYNNSDKSDDANVKIGSNVLIGYIPQIIDFKNNNATVLDVARKYFNGTETYLRASLAKFMFNGDNVFKKVGNLSGGEKIRLKLFELMQQNINFLIMDEPTNHIDITTKEVLENSLNEFQGTILFISHDRYFINELAKKILCIDNQTITEYLGNYDDYKIIKEKQLIREKKSSK
ncbi:MAG: ABC-F family ATP-binding cassette domain-containing protein [Bacilli bacterium]|nr:ABC-F family ATP-binding cassette domain-containing protein [Bacilli bacterium]